MSANVARNSNQLTTTSSSVTKEDYFSGNKTLSLRQPLFNLQRFFQYKQAQDVVTEAEATFERELQNLTVRVGAAYLEALLSAEPLDLILCDDGLQHYRLARDLELVLIDAVRGLGNGRCLPAGPLREPPSRLAEVDFRVINGDWLAAGEPPAAAVTMLLEPGEWLPVATAGSTGPVAGTAIAAGAAARPAAAGQAPQPPARVHAVAGIGHPPRFFTMLAAQGYAPVSHAFPDHHAYRAEELRFTPSLPLVMTEKDAVKCAGIAPPDSWFVPVQAMLPADFWQALHSRLADWRPSDA